MYKQTNSFFILQGNSYANMNEFMADIVLMFENACAYNEPGSVIYKDALIMQVIEIIEFLSVPVVQKVSIQLY